jgi:DNA repair photolyase
LKAIFGTKEWAEETLDIQRGCPNNCRYCYAMAEAIRFKATTPQTWPIAAINLPGMQAKFERLLRHKDPLRIMFPAHHDITTVNVRLCTAAVKDLVAARHQVLVVSKPDPTCIDYMCGQLDVARASVEFRFTIGSVFRTNLQYWEPYAPTLGNRLESLLIARQYGFPTSVSIEPMLDTMPERVVALVRPHVTESIWIGLPNFMAQRLAINGEPDNVRQMGKELTESFTDATVRRIYANLKDDPLVRWKESMKKRLGLKLETKSPGAVKAAEQKAEKSAKGKAAFEFELQMAFDIAQVPVGCLEAMEPVEEEEIDAL